MAKKALIITWNGYQDQEVVYPYYRLLEEGFDLDLLAEDKNQWFYGILGTKLYANFQASELTKEHVKEYDFVLLPGGVKALEKLRQQKNVLEFISAYVNANKVIASTCHGAQLLISAKVTKGRKISGYYSIEDDIVNSGATYSKDPVVIDGNVVTSPHYDHMGVWMRTALAKFRDVNYEEVSQ